MHDEHKIKVFTCKASRDFAGKNFDFVFVVHGYEGLLVICFLL